MKVVRGTAPFIRDTKVSVNRTMKILLLALLPVTAFAIYTFGLDALFVILASVITGVLVEGIISFIQVKKECKKTKKDFKLSMLSITDLTAVVTALIFALTLTADMPIQNVVLGSMFAIGIGKLVFGGFGNNIFNPAAVGRVFVAVSFSSATNVYTQHIDGVSGATSLETGYESLKESGIFLRDLFLGINTSGSIGEVSAFLILVGALILIVTKVADYKLMLSTVASFVLLTFITVLAVDAYDYDFILYQLFAGGLLFGAVFMVTDPVTAPFSGPGRIIYGTLIGFIIFFIRIFGALPEGTAFAIVIVNAFASSLDYFKWNTPVFTRKYLIGMAIFVVVICVITYFAADSLNPEDITELIAGGVM